MSKSGRKPKISSPSSLLVTGKLYLHLFMCHICLCSSYLSPDIPTEILNHLSSSWTALLFNIRKQRSFETSWTTASHSRSFQSLRATDIHLAGQENYRTPMKFNLHYSAHSTLWLGTYWRREPRKILRSGLVLSFLQCLILLLSGYLILYFMNNFRRFRKTAKFK